MWGGVSGPPADLLAFASCWPKVTPAQLRCLILCWVHHWPPPAWITCCVVLPARGWKPGVPPWPPCSWWMPSSTGVQSFPRNTLSAAHMEALVSGSCPGHTQTQKTHRKPQSQIVSVSKHPTPPFLLYCHSYVDVEHSLGWHPSKFSDRT